MQSQYYLSLINQQALLAAAEALRTQDTKMLELLGVDQLDDCTANQLKMITTDRLATLNTFKGILCQLKLDPTGLRLFLGFADGKVTEDELVNQAIRAGMRQPMLEQLKGITRREYAARRARMGLPEHSRGRIEALSEADELLVLRTWGKLKACPDPLQRYLALYEETKIALDQAYTTIHNLA